MERVKELYHKRVSDVRFLIPVLTGLDKQMVISVLPKLITQSQNVVKEVFNRLLGSFQRKFCLQITDRPIMPSFQRNLNFASFYLQPLTSSAVHLTCYIEALLFALPA